MSTEGLQALDENGEMIQDSGDYDELEAIFSKGEAGEQGDSDTSTEDQTEGEADDGGDLPPKKDEQEVKEKGKEEETGKKQEGDKQQQPAPVDAVDEKKPTATIPDETSELKLLLREQRKQLALMEAKLSRLENRPVVKPEEEDENGNPLPAKEETFSDLEQYQKELNEVAITRTNTLNDLLAVMSVNPKYEDVEDVCTRTRFDDIFEAAAKDMVAKEGGNLTTAQLAIELNVWKKPNPYAYMYDVIKKYHPDFAKKEGEVKKTEDPPKQEKKVKTPATDVPLSALDLGKGGSGKSFGEWTAERIDTMDEAELSKVPKNVYDAYLRGDLDK